MNTQSASGPVPDQGAAGYTYARRLLGAAARLEARLARVPLQTALMTSMAILFSAMTVLAASPTLFVVDHWPDLFIGLEAAQHWGHGHRPHKDFHTPLGAAYVAVMGLAGTVADFGPHTLIWANIGVAALAALTLMTVTFRRLSPPLAAVVSLYWALLALSPRRLAFGPEYLSWAGAYNKWGFALVAGLWLAAAIPARRGGRRAAFIETVILGAVLCFLFYLKLTYFAGGMAAFVFKALVLDRGPQRRATLMPVLVGMGMIALVTLFGSVSLSGYAHDLLMAAHAAAGITLARVGLDLHVNILLVGANFAAYLAHFRAYRNADREAAAWASRRRALFSALFILSLATNTQNTSIAIPLLAMLPLVLAVDPARGWSGPAHSRRMAMTLVPILYCLWWGGIDAVAVGQHYFRASSAKGLTFCAQSELAVCRMRVTDTNVDHPLYRLAYADTRPLHEELYRALDPLVTRRSRIVELSFTNMLDTRYGLEPARGGLLFWHYQRNFNDHTRPEPADVFADATLVVMARNLIPNSLDHSLPRLYGRYVREHFTLAAETENWKIYKRP